MVRAREPRSFPDRRTARDKQRRKGRKGRKGPDRKSTQTVRTRGSHIETRPTRDTAIYFGQFSRARACCRTPQTLGSILAVAWAATFSVLRRKAPRQFAASFAPLSACCSSARETVREYFLIRARWRYSSFGLPRTKITRAQPLVGKFSRGVGYNRSSACSRAIPVFVPMPRRVVVADARGANKRQWISPTGRS